MSPNNENSQSFSTNIIVAQTPHQVFEAVTNPRAWWSKDITGNTAAQDDEFEFEVPGIH